MTDPAGWTAAHLADRVTDLRQVARADEYTLADGGRRIRLSAARGFDVEILPDRGFDLGAVAYDGVPLGFCTPAIRTPAVPDGSDEQFARRFGAGLLTTCGLDSYGLPTQDAGQHLPQHGRAADLSAHEVAVRTEWVDGAYRLTASGRMRQWRLVGEDLDWRRTVSIDLGGDTLVITDAVTNQGRTRWPHMMLYHLNLGFPMLDGTSTIEVSRPGPPEEPTPRDETARGGLGTWSRFPEPLPGEPEQVFRHDLPTDRPGEVTVTTPSIGRALTVQVDPAQLPYVFQWRSARAGLYALGIEPGNVPTMDGRAVARAAGVLPYLEPGERADYRVGVRITPAG
ncbi:DUF4432 family protein [Nakamurella flavida]|uniref:DUF4432 family protein n=1 Tax=Nakamurella flavida TaxID=363630 RepID=A0A939C469_9ACTN|nr:DUF4432 family protein [Nakamurella flavida]MBM9477796.1 DUF4432 family protein [Nakamurella flavida]MDP9779349.1 hypothetical protein [Nakamurella flavida]